MDISKAEYFKVRYSRMSDEDLTEVLIDRHERLSGEANLALTEVLAGRDQTQFMREVDAKVEDLNWQAEVARRNLEKIEAERKKSRPVVFAFFGGVIVLLVLALLFGA